MDKGSKCRICLIYRKKVRSVHDAEDGITFAHMITSIADVKIQKDGENEVVCVSCVRKLRDAYNFKLQIERAELALNEQYNRKIIHFNNIKDVSVLIDIDCKPITVDIKPDPEQLFKGENVISYSDTTIKRVETKNNSNTKKSLTVVEFLNSIKTEEDLDRDYMDCDIGVADYPDDSGSDYSLELKERLKKEKKKKVKKKSHASQKTYNENNKKNKENNPKKNNEKPIKPIKPITLSDIRPVRTVTLQKPKERKKKSTADYRQKTSHVCPYCGKIVSSLKSHIVIHTDERSFKCDMCSQAFFRATSLANHKTNVHIGEKIYKCDKCVASFRNKTAFLSHSMVHVDVKNYICEVCTKAFKRKGALRRHRLQHNLGNKRILCSLCPMTFYNNTNLAHHMRVHTGERPFKCEICSQPYSYKHDFNRHCLNKHGVFIKRRNIRVMNEEILQRERALMKDLMLRAHGVLKRDEVPELFDGPQAALAFEQAMKVIESRQLPISL